MGLPTPEFKMLYMGFSDPLTTILATVFCNSKYFEKSVSDENRGAVVSLLSSWLILRRTSGSARVVCLPKILQWNYCSFLKLTPHLVPTSR